MLKKYSDVYASIVLLVLAAVMYMGTLNMKRLTDSVVGSEFAPRLVAGGIFILSVILLINGFRKARDFKVEEDNSLDELEGEAEEAKEPINYMKVFWAALFFAIYIALMKPIGFLIMTAVYLFATMLLLSDSSQRKIPLFLIVSVIVSVVVYYIFKNLFYLFLPSGILG